MVHSSPEETPLSLPLTDTAIGDYRQHIHQFPDTDPAILAYLTRHINGLMCAEIEQVITEMVKRRLQIGCKDTATFNYLSSLRRSTVRNAKVFEIRNTIGLFGNEYRLKFSRLIDETLGEEGVERLGIAVGKRDENAHETPPNVTFRELETAFGIAVQLITIVQLTLE